MPGIVQAHGLGGYAKQSHATGPAYLLDMFVLAYTGPGGIPPEGEGDAVSEGLSVSDGNGYRLFDTIPDVRGSWLWGHAMAAMRGLTCLEHHQSVDPDRLGLTGYSAGGVVTLISSGVDDRIVAAVPLSGHGGWDVATAAPAAWQHTLLQVAGLTIASEQWRILLDELDSTNLLPTTTAQIMMVNGSTDEFFPLTAHMATYRSISPAVEKRMSIAANYDHGCYAISGIENAGDIEQRASIRAEGAQRMWFRHWFETDSTYEYVPAQPAVIAANPLYVAAAVDGGGSQLDVERVKFWGSNDYGATFWGFELTYNDSLGLWDLADVGLAIDPALTIYFVDVLYKGGTLDLEKYSLTSDAHIPVGPEEISIREMTNCTWWW